jgi:hypothetical protein
MMLGAFLPCLFNCVVQLCSPDRANIHINRFVSNLGGVAYSVATSA